MLEGHAGLWLCCFTCPEAHFLWLDNICLCTFAAEWLNENVRLRNIPVHFHAKNIKKKLGKKMRKTINSRFKKINKIKNIWSPCFLPPNLAKWHMLI